MDKSDAYFLCLFGVVIMFILVLLIFGVSKLSSQPKQLSYVAIIDCYYKDKLPYCLVIPDSSFDF